MGRGIVQLFQVFSFLFILLSGGLVYWQIVRSPALQVVPENPRLVEEEARIVRGEVLDRQGKPLVVNEGGNRKYIVSSLAHTLGFVNPRLGPTGLEESQDAALAARSVE